MNNVAGQLNSHRQPNFQKENITLLVCLVYTLHSLHVHSIWDDSETSKDIRHTFWHVTLEMANNPGNLLSVILMTSCESRQYCKLSEKFEHLSEMWNYYSTIISTNLIQTGVERVIEY